MLATERRDLMNWGGEDWSWIPGIEPAEDTIIPWTQDEAAAAFIARYHQLLGGRLEAWSEAGR
jgi:hypothetical protein